MTDKTEDKRDYSDELNSQLSYETKMLVGRAYLRFLEGNIEEGKKLLQKINEDPVIKGKFVFIWNERCGAKGFTIEALI